MALKLKFVKGGDCETHNCKEVRKRSTKMRLKRMRKRWGRRNERFQFLSLLKWTTFCAHFFPMVKCTSTNSIFTTLMDCMRISFTFPTISRGSSLDLGEFYTSRGTTPKNSLTTFWKRVSLRFFSQEERKCLVEPMTSCCMVDWVMTCSLLTIALNKY